MLQRLEFVTYCTTASALKWEQDIYHRPVHTSEGQFWQNEQVQSLEILRVGFGQYRILYLRSVAVLPKDAQV